MSVFIEDILFLREEEKLFCRGLSFYFLCGIVA